MGERLNFICVCGRLLRTDEYRAAFQGIFTSLGDFAITPVEVRRMGGEASEETTVPWADSAPLFAASLGADQLLFGYFLVAATEAAGRQSIALETRRNLSVITVSFDPRILRAGVPERRMASQMLAKFAAWALENFNIAALACGPELDLYEAKEEMDIRQIELRLSLDWRCWSSILTYRRQAAGG